MLRQQNSAAVVAAFHAGREQLLTELRMMRWAYALGVVPLLMFLFYRSWRSLVGSPAEAAFKSHQHHETRNVDESHSRCAGRMRSAS